MEITPGLYRHFKGGLYLVLHLEIDEETLEQRVCYICLKTGKVWSRKASKWNESVLWPSQKYGPRFMREEDYVKNAFDSST